MESSLATDISDLIDETRPQSSPTKLVGNNIDVNRDPRRRLPQNESTLLPAPVYSISLITSDALQKASVIATAAEKKQIESDHGVAPASDPQGQLLQSLQASRSSSSARHIRQRKPSPQRDGKKRRPSSRFSSIESAPRQRHHRTSPRGHEKTVKPTKDSLLPTSASRSTTAVLTPQKGMPHEERGAIVSRISRKRIVSAKRSKAGIAGAPAPSSPKRPSYGVDTSSRLLSDSKGELEYIKGVGMKRVDDDELEAGVASQIPPKRFDSEDTIFPMKSVSTKARHAVMKELQWTAAIDSFYISLNEHDKISVPAKDISHVAYNMDFHSIYLSVPQHESTSILSGEVILVVNGDQPESFRLRSLLERRIGATKVTRVESGFFEAKEYEFQASRNTSLPPARTTREESSMQPGTVDPNLSDDFVESALNGEGLIDGEPTTVIQARSHPNTTLEHFATIHNEQAEKAEKNKVSRVTNTTSTVTEKNPQGMEELSDTIVLEPRHIQHNKVRALPSKSRTRKPGKQAQVSREVQNMSERFKDSVRSIEQIGAAPKSSGMMDIRTPHQVTSDSKVHNKLTKQPLGPVITDSESHESMEQQDEVHSGSTSKANQESLEMSPNIDNSSVLAATTPLPLNKAHLSSAEARIPTRLSYRSGEPVNLNDLVIRIRDPTDMPDGYNKFDKLDVYDGPWRITRLPISAATPTDLFSNESEPESTAMGESSKKPGLAKKEFAQAEKLIKLEFPSKSTAEAWTKLGRLRPVYEIPKDVAEAEPRMLYYQGKQLGASIRNVASTDAPSETEDDGSKEMTGVCKIQKGAYVKVHYVAPEGPDQDDVYEVERLRGRCIWRCSLRDHPDLVSDETEPMISQYIGKENCHIAKDEVLVFKYLVHWAGWPSEDDTWETGKGNIPQCFLDAYEANTDPYRGGDPGDFDRGGLARAMQIVDKTTQSAKKRRKSDGKKAIVVENGRNEPMRSPKRKVSVAKRRKS